MKTESLRKLVGQTRCHPVVSPSFGAVFDSVRDLLIREPGNSQRRQMLRFFPSVELAEKPDGIMELGSGKSEVSSICLWEA